MIHEFIGGPWDGVIRDLTPKNQPCGCKGVRVVSVAVDGGEYVAQEESDPPRLVWHGE